eukprot:gnl/TRDRNA2_/TRDRNA2_177138_c1_seq3.p1 gnl/TRDRNA2_/TRDRNA2_177138_c1~~gnl/TRDRNA2_/TRDRNA2_177138_c1_seq3.p1  ORF type:complete len:161 (+),score=20.01 gnl/TRDRNA2_/TRDRNA2_177138_c1_seq3:800-1282(+)
MAAARRSLVVCTGEFTQQNMANLAWACAQLGYSDWPLLEAIAAESRRIMSSYRAQGLGNLSWAFAKLAYKDEPLLQSIASEARKKLHECGAQQLANIVWSSDVCGRRNLNDVFVRSATGHFLNASDPNWAITWVDYANPLSLYMDSDIAARHLRCIPPID